MAYLTMFRIEGDPDELLEHKRAVMDPKVAPVARENGPSSTSSRRPTTGS